VPSETEELIIPGLYGSAPEHWQSRWLRARAQAKRVELGQWDDPSRDVWIAHLDRAIGRQRQPVLLVAHSLGCLAVAWWAGQASVARLAKVRGALLVAPPDVDRPDAVPVLRRFAPAPMNHLPFPSLLVASRNDPYATFERLAQLAQAWGAGLADVGWLGHINAESGLGDWPQGVALLDLLRHGIACVSSPDHIILSPLEQASGKGSRA
jgi:predicted alpha/beta hydrolase family esterase